MAAGMLDTFGIQQGGSHNRRLVASFQRIFGATIFFGTDTLKDRAAVVHCARFNFMTEARIWYSRNLDQKCLPCEFQNEIVLSDEFFRGDSSLIRFRQTWRLRRLCRVRQRLSTSSHGFHTDASLRKAANEFRCSAKAAL